MAVTHRKLPREYCTRPTNPYRHQPVIITAADRAVDWAVTCTDCKGMDVRVFTRDGAIAFGLHHRDATHSDRALVGFSIDP